MSETAFAPANGSLIFETYEATAEYGRGSLGVGFTLDAGVRVEVEEAAESAILVGGQRWDFPTVAQVLARLAKKPVVVKIEADFPFGCGFGMSGASALATAYALGRMFWPKLSPRDLAMVAHEAEVENATGRGDVGGQFNGGWMVKTRKGAPLKVQWLPIPETTVYCRIFGPISTKEVISDRATMDRVNAAGHAALQALAVLPHVTLDQLLGLSLTFARESGLLRSERMKAAIAEAEAAGGKASMVMLGEAVVSSVPIAGATAHRVCRNPAR